MVFQFQSPKLIPGASCSLCSFSTPCLSSKQDPPDLIMLESRFRAALLPPSSGISTFPGTLQSFYGMPYRAQPSSQTSPCLSPPPALCVIHITPPAILNSLIPSSPFPPEHDPRLLWIIVFTKLKLKINFNYQNQIAVSINHLGPLGDTDRRLHLDVEGR